MAEHPRPFLAVRSAIHGPLKAARKALSYLAATNDFKISGIMSPKIDSLEYYSQRGMMSVPSWLRLGSGFCRFRAGLEPRGSAPRSPAPRTGPGPGGAKK